MYIHAHSRMQTLYSWHYTIVVRGAGGVLCCAKDSDHRGRIACEPPAPKGKGGREGQGLILVSVSVDSPTASPRPYLPHSLVRCHSTATGRPRPRSWGILSFYPLLSHCIFPSLARLHRLDLDLRRTVWGRWIRRLGFAHCHTGAFIPHRSLLLSLQL